LGFRVKDVGCRTEGFELPASPMEIPCSLDAIARSASMRAPSAARVAAGTVAAVTSIALARPMVGSRLE